MIYFVPYMVAVGLGLALAGVGGCSADLGTPAEGAASGGGTEAEGAEVFEEEGLEGERMTVMRLDDFADPQVNARWRMVNDDVMGGRSEGDVAFDQGVMTFSGSINTNGGGFSSVRRSLEPGMLSRTQTIRLRLKIDGRPYRLLLEDDLPERRRSVIHRQDMVFDPAVPHGEWQTVDVNLDRLTPTHHGDPINAQPLDKSRAVRLGLMLNDTHDGPFELQSDWIELVEIVD